MTRHTDNRLALGRLGALVEQLHALVRSGRQVILVTSGACCVGRQVLRQQHILNSSPLQMMGNHNFCGARLPPTSLCTRGSVPIQPSLCARLFHRPPSCDRVMQAALNTSVGHPQRHVTAPQILEDCCSRSSAIFRMPQLHLGMGNSGCSVSRWMQRPQQQQGQRY